MSEEKEIQESGWSTLKKSIVGGAVAILTTVGGIVTTQLEKCTGTEKEETKTEQPAAAAPVINLQVDNSSKNQAASSGGGTTTIIKERTVEKPAAVESKPAKAEPAKDEEPW